MQSDKITAIFDQQASSYDQKWSKLGPINGALHLLTSAVFSALPTNARILCVGAGTGAEILYFARRFPGWQFTAVEPSTGMMDVLRRRTDEQGISSRCSFHPGFLDSLSATASFDAATAFLVSQFIQDRQARSMFFRNIAERLRPDGLLVSSDLAGDVSDAPNRTGLLELWFDVMRDNAGSPPADGIEKMREAYVRDVAVLPPSEVRDIIQQGGFDAPVQFFQAGMIHAFRAKRSSTRPIETVSRNDSVES